MFGTFSTDAVRFADPVFDHERPPMIEYPARIEDMPEDEYHAREEFGSSAIRQAESSVSHLRKYVDEGISPSKSMRIGTAVHQAVLEPDRFQRAYVDCRPPVDVSGMYKNYVTAAEMFARDATPEEIAEAVGVKPSTAEDYGDRDDVQALAEHYREHGVDSTPDVTGSDLDTVRRMRDRVLDNAEAMELISGSDREVSYFAELDGVPCKGRADVVTSNGLVDLKTTGKRDGAKEGVFFRTVPSFGYHIQAAMYLRLACIVESSPRDRFGWIVVESGGTYNVGVHWLKGSMFKHAGWKLEQGLENAKSYLDDPTQPGFYRDEASTIELPKYAQDAPDDYEWSPAQKDDVIANVPF